MALSWTRSPGAASVPLLTASAPLETLPIDVSPLFEQLAQRIRSEYREMPGLDVTAREQARAVRALDSEMCDRLLDHLVRTGFLAHTRHAYAA